MGRWIFGMVDREQWRPCRIVISFRIAVFAGSWNCRAGSPKSKVILCFETRDNRIGCCRINHGEQAGSVANVQAPTQCEADEVPSPVYVSIFRPEIGNVRLLRRSETAVRTAKVTRFDKILPVEARD